MSGIQGWRDGSRYRMATTSGTPGSSQDYLWDSNNKREEAEKPQKPTTSKEEQSGQASDRKLNGFFFLFSVNPYVLITPNKTRRNQLQQIAKKELDDLQRWKEEHRRRPINLVPQRLGGKQSEAQVRQNQQMMLLKRIEHIKAKKEAEETEILKKKALQREKAERLEAKKRQQEMQRREMFLEDQHYKTNELLNRLDLGLPKSDSCQIANHGAESTAWMRSHTYKQALREDETRRLEEMKQEQRRKIGIELRIGKTTEFQVCELLRCFQALFIFYCILRVNNAFLDRLQNKTQPTNIHQPEHSGGLD
uniref:Uncharacterized protein n=1 Tax=Melopsittacus undulatus TaxID=13146 RepID=A0A8C6K0S4_MELUD